MKTTNTQHTPTPWHIGMHPGPMVYGPKGEMVSGWAKNNLVEAIAEARSAIAKATA